MKRFILPLVLCVLIIVVGIIFKEDKKTSDLKKISVAEVTHSVFYAPSYVAHSLGYFEDEGLDVDIILTPGADKVTAAVLSGVVQIGFCGSEATIYVYNGGEKDYLKTFAQLTQKDGTFLVSRKEYKNFKLDDLKGKTVIGGRAAGMPEMTFEYALKQNGIDPKNDLNIDTSVAFPAMSGAFIGGQGDFVTLFEPTATEVEKQGYGHVVASIGELGGIVPYTSYSARISYINNNKELIKNFDKAIQKGLDYVKNHSDKEVAKAILKQFPDTSLNDLTNAVKRYREIEAWAETTKFSEESFNHLQDIMIDYGELQSKVDYSKLIYNEK